MIIGSSYSDFHEILQLKNDTKIELMMAMQKTIRASERASRPICIMFEMHSLASSGGSRGQLSSTH